MSKFNSIGAQFIVSLTAVERTYIKRRQQNDKAEKIRVASTGRTITGAYEQLRNAAEYIDDSLLLQRAIRRFYRRVFLSGDEVDIANSGEELITELTLAGYLPNETVAKRTSAQISKLAVDYLSAYNKLHHDGSTDDVYSWTIDLLAVEVAALLTEIDTRDVFLQFAFESFIKSINWPSLFRSGVPENYELCLYITLHQVLLKSDSATIRWHLLKRFQRAPDKYNKFVTSNKTIDSLLVDDNIAIVTRAVSKYSASFRILRGMMKEHDNFGGLLSDKNSFLSSYENQINREYKSAENRVKRGIKKSIVFLIITKVLIGLAIEVPYDLAVHGAVEWLVLAINLTAPIIYLISIGFTIKVPGRSNTLALVEQMSAWLFDSKPMKLSMPKKQKYSGAFGVVYGFLMLLIFGLASWGLISLGFDIVHLLVFMTFFSAASFLGFRLTKFIKEVEAFEGDQSSIAMLRDFIYLPFVVVGRKLNQEYAKLNLVANVLDLVIEMPLKSILKLVRQWSVFISSKKDEL